MAGGACGERLVALGLRRDHMHGDVAGLGALLELVERRQARAEGDRVGTIEHPFHAGISEAGAIKLSDLTEDPQFREYQVALGRIIAASLAPVVHRAEMVGAQVIDVVLAGGGSHLPFLPDLVRNAAGVNPRSVPLRVSPLSPTSKLYEGIAAMNKEWTSFVNRRLKEDFGIAEQLANCTTTEDMLRTCTGYVRTAWTDYQSGKTYAGAAWHDIAAGPVPVVVLVRDHTVIPTVAVAQSTKDIDWAHVDLRVTSSDKAPSTGWFMLPTGDPVALTVANGKLTGDPLKGQVTFRVK